MGLERFYEFIKTESAKKFLKLFGGSFQDCMNSGFAYRYGETFYRLPIDTPELVEKSIEFGENLLFKLETM